MTGAPQKTIVLDAKEQKRSMIVAIDGPAGSGKSTVARAVARDCGFVYLDTGAMYRSVALVALSNDVAPDDADGLTTIAESMSLTFGRNENGEQTVCVNGSDVTAAIRTPQVDGAVSLVSGVPAVRSIMVERQRALAEGVDAVAEGRDIGTVVFPDAEVKVFLTASPEARAHRRAEQNRARSVGTEASDEGRVLASLIERDRADSTRAVSPLRPAPDAVHIDSSSLTIEEVVHRVEQLVAQARAAVSEEKTR